jgi:seryl-tRNA synthetase
VRSPPRTGNEYSYLVESYRENGEVKQRVLKYLGRAGKETSLGITPGAKNISSQISEKTLTISSDNAIVKANKVEEKREMENKIDEAMVSRIIERVNTGKIQRSELDQAIRDMQRALNTVTMPSLGVNLDTVNRQSDAEKRIQVSNADYRQRLPNYQEALRRLTGNANPPRRNNFVGYSEAEHVDDANGLGR